MRRKEAVGGMISGSGVVVVVDVVCGVSIHAWMG